MDYIAGITNFFDNNMLLVSIIEVLYLIYMFNFFKTTIEFHHPFEIFLTSFSKYLKHPIKTGIYENKICRFGNDISYIFAIYIILRFILYKTNSIKKNTLCMINKTLIYVAFVVSLLMNMNAVIYLIPLLLLEYYYFIQKFC
tara:strand:+ start:6816 stop:7241 length:426 start_codon:yes stop_codon:yes gene_type:complete